MEQQSGPPRVGDTREERFKPQPVDPPDPATIEPEPPTAPIEPETVIGAGRTEPTDRTEPAGTDEAGPIMSSLPRSRPQQRSARRPPAKKRAATGESAAKPRRSTASARKTTGRTSAGAGAQSRSKPAAKAQAKAGSAPGMPRLAVDAATQIATAPLRLTVNATRRTAGFIRRGLGL